MKNFIWIFLFFGIGINSFAANYYVSTSGSDSNNGSISSPFKTLETAIALVNPGDYIYLRGGTHVMTSQKIVIQSNGTSSANIFVYAYQSEVPILQFNDNEVSSNRGIVMDADYWHWKGITIEKAGDNGMLLSGNNNTIEECIFRKNHDTGLQLSRYKTSDNSIDLWPSDNLILNCEAYDNSDSDHEDADGFAAKLTCGTGNVFRGCVSHHNIDDGWDLYTKSSTGVIGEILIEDCIAHNNGTLTDGNTSGSGDKNGFKLGSSANTVNHTIRRCIAFNNGKHGFTDNGNIGSMKFINCTSYGNSGYNFHTRDNASHVFINNISFGGGHADRIVGDTSAPNAFDTSDEWPFTASSNDFTTMTPGTNSDPTANGFLNLKEGSDLIDAGLATSGITYSGSAPDLGAIESGETSSVYYELSIAIEGSGSVSPENGSYQEGSIVSLTATASTGWTFSNWSGNISSTSSTITVTMNSSKSITATFTKNDSSEDDPNTGLGDNLSTTGTGVSSDGSSKASGTSYGNVRDEDMSTIWSPASTSDENITIKWNSNTTSNTVIIKEVTNNVTSWQLEDKDKNVLATGTTLGSSKQIDYASTTTKKIRLVINSASAIPQIGEFEVYNASSTTTASISMDATSGAGLIDLNWSISNITFNSLAVYRDTDSDPSGRIRIASLAESVTSYTDLTVSAGITYYYWIKITDTNGDTTNSNSASATPYEGRDRSVSNDMIGFATVSGDGYSTTTGGQGGSEITISSLSELKTWASSRENNTTPEIVYISGKISSSTSQIVTIKHGANISILGIGSSSELENVGINIRDYENVIVRNLKIHEILYPNDALTLDKINHGWVDHCELHSKIGDGITVDTYDGLLDIKKGSKYITISWCYLHDHMKTVLIGHTDSDSQKEQDSEIRVTFHHNFFENTNGRNPSLRYGAVHMFNNYLNDIDDYGIAVRKGAHAKLENNVYHNVNIPITTDKFKGIDGYACASGNIFSGTSGSNSITQTGCDWWTSTTLPYSYTLDPVSSVISTIPDNVGVGKISELKTTIIPLSTITNNMAPEAIELRQNYPNPFTTNTSIEYTLVANSKVNLSVFDLKGQKVAVLVNNNESAGSHKIKLDHTDLPCGTYIYRLLVNDVQLSKKMIKK